MDAAEMTRRESDKNWKQRIQERAAESFIKSGPWAIQAAVIFGAILLFGWNVYKDQRDESKSNNASMRVLIENNTRAMENNTSVVRESINELRTMKQDFNGRLSNVENALINLGRREFK